MSEIKLLDLLQQDIEDIKGLMHYEECGLTKDTMKKHAEIVISNLQNHLEELIKN